MMEPKITVTPFGENGAYAAWTLVNASGVYVAMVRGGLPPFAEEWRKVCGIDGDPRIKPEEAA